MKKLKTGLASLAFAFPPLICCNTSPCLHFFIICSSSPLLLPPPPFYNPRPCMASSKYRMYGLVIFAANVDRSIIGRREEKRI